MGEIKIKWLFKERLDREEFGQIEVEVLPPEGMNNEALHRIVFSLPEYYDSAMTSIPPDTFEGEPFRVDSSFYFRVSACEQAIYSKVKNHLRRNCLSFRLCKNQWIGGIYLYDQTNLDFVVARVKEDLSKEFTSRITEYQLGKLPSRRLLSPSQVDTWNDAAAESIARLRPIFED
ncbi:hypothetical protein GPA19_05425 [Azoarcus indigens]|uniref:Uncharacterized protein n=1 Tax=Azoarcus indigens TaxID=29545 RepID=A0A4R6DVA9_9RHOO|nr:hypothetical protein [Azoarcus indigens]NMG64386.1 hypothetical protein [Azoarcus indigens]TDN49160.1 hypothetical protein C7389_11211 [Azoarcus indigens]